MAKLFLEVIAAPGFDDEAKAKFAAKKNLRLVQVIASDQKWVLKNVSGGMLVQDADIRTLTEADLRVVTKRPPTPEEKRALLFGWKVCKHVKSNAILYVRDGQTVGVGAGQMSRVDSCKLGAMKAQLPLKGTVAASDAFFPVSGRRGRDCQGRVHGDYPTRRLGSGPGGHRGRRSPRDRHDLHWSQALPALIHCRVPSIARLAWESIHNWQLSTGNRKFRVFCSPRPPVRLPHPYLSFRDYFSAFGRLAVLSLLADLGVQFKYTHARRLSI